MMANMIWEDHFDEKTGYRLWHGRGLGRAENTLLESYASSDAGSPYFSVRGYAARKLSSQAQGDVFISLKFLDAMFKQSFPDSERQSSYDDLNFILPTMSDTFIKNYERAMGAAQDSSEVLGRSDTSVEPYRIPARGTDGMPLWLPSPFLHAIEGVELPIFWRKLFISSVSEAPLSEDAVSSFDPEYSLWIRPGSDCESLAPGTDIGFDIIAQTVKDIAQSEGLKTKVLFDSDIQEEARSKYVFLSESPFRHYQTWIHVDELKTHLNHPNEPSPTAEHVMNAKELAEKGASRPRIHAEKAARPERALEKSLFLTAEKIAAALKRFGNESGKEGTRIAASEVASALGWSDSTATWLNPTPYFWGGICEFGNEMHQTRPLQDLVLGTAESSGVFSRYQSAWNTLFYKERFYRQLNHEASAPSQLPNGEAHGNSDTVLGFLCVQRSEDLLEQDLDGKALFEATKLNDNEELLEILDPVPWLCPTLQFQISMSNYSHLLKRYKPSFKVDIYPFTKLFSSKLESLTDNRLMEILFSYGPEKVGWEEIDPYTAFLMGLDGDFPHIEASLPDSSNYSPSKLANEAIIGISEQLEDVSNDVIAEARTRLGPTSDKLIHTSVEIAEVVVEIAAAPGVNGEPTPAPSTEIQATATVVAKVEPDASTEKPTKSIRKSIISKTKHALHLGSRKKTQSAKNGTGRHLPLSKDEIKETATKLYDKTSEALLAAGVKDIKFIKDGFEVKEDLFLFGFFPARLYSSKAHPTKDQPLLDVVIPGLTNFTLGDIMPALKGGPFDHSFIANPKFSYAAVSNNGLPIGTSFEGSLPLTGTFDFLSKTAGRIFKERVRSVKIRSFLGPTRNWKNASNRGSIIFQVELSTKATQLGDILQFANLNAEISLYEERKIYKAPEWSHEFSFFGGVGLAVPGSLAPLRLSYLIRQAGDDLMLYLTNNDDEWKDVFGVKGLSVSTVNFSAIIDDIKETPNIAFDVQAVLKIGKGGLAVRGFYSKDDYYLEAFLGDISLNELGEIFTSITGYAIEPKKHDILFEKMSLRVSKDGFILTGGITVNGHTSAEGRIVVSPDGLEISGLLRKLKFTGFDINMASLSVFLGRENKHLTSRETRVAIEGKVSIHDFLDIDCTLYFEKDGDELTWVAFAEIEGDISTGRLVPQVKGTFLDISVSRVAFLASNETRSALDRQFGYPVLQGVHLCGLLTDNIPAIDNLLRSKEKLTGLVLRAGHTGTGFQLGIQLPESTQITIGENVTVGLFDISFDVSKAPSLQFKSPLFVKISTQPDPLEFQFGLRAGLIEGEGFGHMTNDWKNPFGISERVSIGSVAVQVGIVYQTFVMTGIPGSVGFSGKLAIGSKIADVAIKVSQDPTKELIYARVKDLSLLDLVKFAAKMVGQEINPPQEVLRFENVQVYLSQGAKVGIKEYPRGASFKGQMKIFGKKANLECTIKTGIVIKASIENFELGPLVVKGFTKPDPQMEIEISASRQIIDLDGKVNMLGFDIDLHLKSSIYPVPSLEFAVGFKFSGLLTFDMRAAIIGPADVQTLNNLKDADFELYARLEQRIVERIAKQIQAQILGVKDASPEELAEKQAELLKQEQEVKTQLDDLSSLLKTLQERREARRKEVLEFLEQTRKDREARMAERRKRVEEARKTIFELNQDLQRDLLAARTAAEAALQASQLRIAARRRERELVVRGLQERIQSRKKEFYKNFGVGIDVPSLLPLAEADAPAVEVDGDRLLADEPTTPKDVGCFARFKSFGKKRPQVVAETIVSSTTEGMPSNSAPPAIDPSIPAIAIVETKTEIESVKSELEEVAIEKANSVDAAIQDKNALRDEQNAVINTIQAKLEAVTTSTAEAEKLRIAEEALAKATLEAEKAVSTAEKHVTAFEQTAESLALKEAEKRASLLRESSRELQLASHILDVIQQSAETLSKMTTWLGDGKANLLNIKEIEMGGRLRAFVVDKKPLKAKIRATVFDREVEFEVGWDPAQRARFLKELFDCVWGELRRQVLGGSEEV